MIDTTNIAPEFQAWPKTPRLFRDMIVTEKLDGTNAAVIVTEDGAVAAQSRKRLIAPGKTTDNYGFASWVEQNAEQLRALGPGRHFGEWYGAGIQHGYGLEPGDRRFALFNPYRYRDCLPVVSGLCQVVPVVWVGGFCTATVRASLARLSEHGSFAVPGFMRPEGVCIYHTASGRTYKALLDSDHLSKGEAQAMLAEAA